jgi:hypothetical protein
MSEIPVDQNREYILPIESEDDAALRMFGGATFSGDAKIILPSGRVLGADEAQAFTSAYDDQQSHAAAIAYRREELKRLAEMDKRRDERRDERRGVNHLNDPDNPLSSANDNWTGDPKIDRPLFVQHALEALHGNSKTEQPLTSKKGWLKRILGL